MAYSWAEIKRFDRRQKQKRHIVAKKAHKLLAPFSDQFLGVSCCLAAAPIQWRLMAEIWLHIHARDSCAKVRPTVIHHANNMPASNQTSLPVPSKWNAYPVSTNAHVHKYNATDIKPALKLVGARVLRQTEDV